MSRARDTADQINRINSSAADATAITVDSSENVGIGTSSPAGVSGTSLVVHDTSAPRVRLTNDTTGQAGTDGSEITVNGSDLVIENRENTANTRFYNGGAERLRILSGGGITFNGDTAAANALSDYEEGSHDCTVTMSSGSCSLYSNYNKIKYTKIGNLVMIQGQIRVESVSSPSGEMLVSMPFSMDTTADEGSNISGSLVRTYSGNAPTGGLFLHGTMVFNRSNNCSLQWSKSGSATVNHVPVANEYLLFNFTYNVA